MRHAIVRFASRHLVTTGINTTTTPVLYMEVEGIVVGRKANTVGYDEPLCRLSSQTREV